MRGSVAIVTGGGTGIGAAVVRRLAARGVACVINYAHSRADAEALARQSYVAAVTPTVSTSKTLRVGSQEASALVNGVGEQYFSARGTKLAEGSFFDAGSVRARATDVVIDG